MKAFALVLLCVVAAAQGRSTGSHAARWTDAEAGDAPWLVHLRVAIWTSGLLNTCAASIIDQRWLLTSATCVDSARFIWSRYGALDVFRPELVLETSSTDVNVIAHAESDIALISINRNVEFTSTIAAPSIAAEDAEIPSSGTFCAYGQNESGDGPGEQLRCIDVTLESDGEGGIIATSEDGEASLFDIGAPLVVDGVQYGVLVDPAAGKFLNPAAFREWIEETTGISLDGEDDEDDEEEEDDGDADEDEEEDDAEEEEEEEEEEDDNEDEEVDAVRFVN